MIQTQLARRCSGAHLLVLKRGMMIGVLKMETAEVGGRGYRLACKGWRRTWRMWQHRHCFRCACRAWQTDKLCASQFSPAVASAPAALSPRLDCCTSRLELSSSAGIPTRLKHAARQDTWRPQHHPCDTPLQITGCGVLLLRARPHGPSQATLLQEKHHAAHTHSYLWDCCLAGYCCELHHSGLGQQCPWLHYVWPWKAAAPGRLRFHSKCLRLPGRDCFRTVIAAVSIHKSPSPLNIQCDWLHAFLLAILHTLMKCVFCFLFRAFLQWKPS